MTDGILINDNNAREIQAFPITANTYKGTASSKDVTGGFKMLRSLAASNTVTFTFPNGSSLAISCEVGDDYSFDGVSSITSTGTILLS